MEKLAITSTVLDKLGFSEYWDENGDWGGRILNFSSGDSFRILEYEENDDDSYGYDKFGKYISNHWIFTGFFAIPKIDDNSCHSELFFIHQMYECVEEYYPNSLEEFSSKLKKLKMWYYIEEYLKESIKQ